MKPITIALHGGAGTINRKLMTPEKENQYKAALSEALDCGFEILKNGGTALDAVEIVIVNLENNPLFNAGKGSVFTHDGRHEMDASIMCGKTLMAGAAAGVHNIQNPVKLARAVMDKSEHVMLFGEGAEDFARLQNLQFQPDSYFFVQARYDQWQRAKSEGTVVLDHNDEKKFGTVGAVALDIHGNLAAGTSTGGMTNKLFGRVGDSPIIGAGTYANNKTCAVSCTGNGEFFIRSVTAYDISCLMEYKGYTLPEACIEVVQKKLKSIGGEGGVISLSQIGEVCFSFNSEGMYRGRQNQQGKEISIWEN